MRSFDEVWKFIRANLKPGDTIKNWTAYKGYLGDVMTINSIHPDHIYVDSPNAATTQKVPRDDFEAFWKVWQDYKSERVRRGDLVDVTRYSKYIISIFNWYDLKQ